MCSDKADAETSFSSIKALVIDDDPSIANMISMLLKSLGVGKVITAFEAETAMRFFNGERPDIVISDFMMPRKDGVDLCKEMKKLNPETPMVIFTGYYEQLTAKLEKEDFRPDYLLKKYSLKTGDFTAIFRECFPAVELDTGN